MQTIYLDGDVEDFIKRIEKELDKGFNVPICMYGFNAKIYAGSPKSAVRRTIISKLRAIENYSTNVLLLKDALPTDLLNKYLSNATPEEVADLCLEQGFTPGFSSTSKSL